MLDYKMMQIFLQFVFHLLFLFVSILGSNFSLVSSEGYSQILSTIHSGVKAYTYSYRLYHSTDRGFSPLTVQMCQTGSNFKNLKSCQLIKDNRELLLEYSSHYLSLDTNLWLEHTQRDVVRDVDLYYSRLFSYKQLFSFRWKRSIPFSPNKERNYNKNKKKLRRSKREIPGNPCVMGQEKRTIIYSALDAETEEPMELLQDAVGSKYQTYYTRDCAKEIFDVYNCEILFVTHEAAVFDNNSGEIIYRPVKIPTTCVMTVPQKSKKN